MVDQQSRWFKVQNEHCVYEAPCRVHPAVQAENRALHYLCFLSQHKPLNLELFLAPSATLGWSPSLLTLGQDVVWHICASFHGHVAATAYTVTDQFTINYRLLSNFV